MSIIFHSKKFFNILNLPLLFFLTFSEINLLNKRSYANTKPAATQQDLFLYKQMGASYLCKAISDKINFDFNKALAISAYTYAEVIYSKHENFIQEAGNEKLTTDRVIYIGEIEILNSAIKICPKLVPNEVKKRFEETLNKLKKQELKKN
jgi:hypothetical protein